MSDSKKILFVKLSSLGDIVHALPTAVAIKRTHPEWDLHWMVSEKFSQILENHPSIDKLIVTPHRPNFKTLMSIKKQLRSEKYDIALDMQGLFKSARFVALSGAKLKLGFHWQREGARFFSKPVKPKKTNIHVVEQYLAVAEELGCQPYPVDFQLHTNEQNLDKSKSLLSSHNIHQNAVAINLGSGKKAKQWAIKKFAILCNLLQKKGLTPFLIGSSSEKPLEDELNQFLPNPIPSLIGKTNLKELVAVLSLSDLHIAGDTGSLHIAVALNVPVIAIMGPTLPERSGPYAKPNNVIWKGVNNLQQIEPEEVINLVEQLQLTLFS
mgnify:CR=1 FL=1